MKRGLLAALGLGAGLLAAGCGRGEEKPAASAPPRVSSPAASAPVAPAITPAGNPAATPAVPAAAQPAGVWLVDREATRVRFRAKALADLEARAAGRSAEELARSRAFIAGLDPTREEDEQARIALAADGTAEVRQGIGPDSFTGRWRLAGEALILSRPGGEEISGVYAGETLRFPAAFTEMPYEVVLRRAP